MWDLTKSNFIVFESEILANFKNSKGWTVPSYKERAVKFHITGRVLLDYLGVKDVGKFVSRDFY